MKKILKSLSIGTIAFVMVIGNGAFVNAVSQNEMVDMISEEMTANYLYTELAKKYPEDRIFVNLAKSESRHTEALKKSAARLGLSVEEAKPADIKIPETKEEALAFALKFEQEDIDMLKKLIEKEDDARLKKVLGNLLRGSTNHYNSLKKAVDGVENPNCNEGGDRKYQNRAGSQGRRSGRREKAIRNPSQLKQGSGRCRRYPYVSLNQSSARAVCRIL